MKPLILCIQNILLGIQIGDFIWNNAHYTFVLTPIIVLLSVFIFFIRTTKPTTHE